MKGEHQSAAALNHNPASHPYLAFLHSFVPSDAPNEAAFKVSRRAAEYIVNVHKIFTSYGQGRGPNPGRIIVLPGRVQARKTSA
jgi:hypothetical protein